MGDWKQLPRFQTGHDFKLIYKLNKNRARASSSQLARKTIPFKNTSVSVSVFFSFRYFNDSGCK